MSWCRSCGARVLWAVTAATGSRMPLDEAPVADGYVTIEAWPNTAVPVATVHAPGGLFDTRPAGAARYVPHHATCPDAARWRRGVAASRDATEQDQAGQ